MKHIYINGELNMVENENDFSELIRENMGEDSERYFQEILEDHDNSNDELYYEMLAESREQNLVDIRDIVEELVEYYFEQEHKLNRKKILKDWKEILTIISNRD